MEHYCISIQGRLGDYLDRALSAKEREAVKAHLSGCQACNEALVMTRELLDGLRELDQTPLPVGFSQRVSARLHQEAERMKYTAPAPRPVANRPWWQLLLPLPVRALGGVAIGVMLFALFFATNPHQGMSPSPVGIIPTVVPTATPVSLGVGGEAVVRIWFESETAVDQVRFTVELPPGLRMVSGGKVVNTTSLTWEGRLEKGRNVIPLPVVGVTQGQWTVSAHLDKDGAHRQRSIDLNVGI